MHDVVMIAIVAGLLAMDERAGWQSLLSEPVFAGPLVGAITGHIGLGVTAGVTLQLVWLSIGAARGSRRPNVVVGGVVGAGVMCLGAARTQDYVLFTPYWILCGLLAGEAGRWLADTAGRWRERWLEGFRLPATAAAASRNLALYTIGSALFVGLVDALAVLAMLPLALQLSEVLLDLVGDAQVGLWMWSIALPGIAVAAIVHAFSARSLVRFMLVGVLLAVVAAWLI